MTARLLHLNGPPGVGKSTLARRWAEDRPGTLALDIDVLRTLLGGWRADLPAAGEVIRPVALAVVAAHLEQGRDVVLPQLLARPEELARFHGAATGVGAEVVMVVLDADDATLRTRWRHRSGDDAWTAASTEVITEQGGDEVVLAYAARVRALAADVPGARLLDTTGSTPDATYAALVGLVG